MSTIVLIEIGAALAGMTGAVVLALNGPRAGWGFVLYLASNAAWIAASWVQGQWPLFTQQLVFAAVSVLGIWVWLVKPLVENWPMVLCGHLNCWADDVGYLGLRYPTLARLSLATHGALDGLALRIYHRFKPAGQKWNPVEGRWEPEA
jgi:hypothetical protein